MTPAEVIEIHRKMTQPNSHRTLSMNPALALLLYIAVGSVGVCLSFWLLLLITH